MKVKREFWLIAFIDINNTFRKIFFIYSTKLLLFGKGAITRNKVVHFGKTSPL